MWYTDRNMDGYRKKRDLTVAPDLCYLSGGSSIETLSLIRDWRFFK